MQLCLSHVESKPISHERHPSGMFSIWRRFFNTSPLFLRCDSIFVAATIIINTMMTKIKGIDWLKVIYGSAEARTVNLLSIAFWKQHIASREGAMWNWGVLSYLVLTGMLDY